MDVPDEVVVTYEYSAAEHVSALEKLPYWRVLRFGQIGSVILYGLMAVANAVYGWVKSESTLGDTIGFVGLSVFWWLAYPGIRAVERYRYRRQTPDGTLLTRRFSPRGFSASPDGPLIPWGLVTRVRETPDAFLISDASSVSWISFPKRALSDEQLAEFRATIAREFESRPNQLKLLQAK